MCTVWRLLILLSFAGLAFAQPKEVSFDCRDTDIQVLLKLFAQETGYNVVAGPTIVGKITCKIQRLDPLKALNLLLQSAGFRYVIQGNTVMVLPTKEALTELRTFRLNYVSVSQVATLISELIRPDLMERWSSSTELNTITVEANPAKLASIETLLAIVDQPPLQVLVEAKMMEISSGNGDNQNPSVIGMNYTYTNPATSTNVQLISQDPGTVQPVGFFAKTLYQNVAAYLTVLEKKLGAKSLASPRVMAVNHKESSILIGSKLGYKTTTTTTTGTSEQVDFLEVGIKLKFTPHIGADGYIRMILNPSISEGSIVSDLPQENTTETSSEVMVKDGQSIVIGGLTKNSDVKVVTGIPFLSGLPFVGYLFGKTETRAQKIDLIIVITPHIVTPELLTQLQEKAQAMEGKVTKEE